SRSPSTAPSTSPSATSSTASSTKSTDPPAQRVPFSLLDYPHPVATTPSMHDERELSASIELCGPNGQLNRQAVGWSRHPVHICNLPPSLPRKKRWNYWAVTS